MAMIPTSFIACVRREIEGRIVDLSTDFSSVVEKSPDLGYKELDKSPSFE